MRWPGIVFIACLFSVLQMRLSPEAGGVYPELGLLMCLYLAERSLSQGVLYAFFITGLARDLLCGLHTGASTLAFVLLGFFALSVCEKFNNPSSTVRLLLAFCSCLGLILGERFLAGAVGWEFYLGDVREAILCAFLTAALSLPCRGFFRLLPLVDRNESDRRLFAGR